MGDTGFAAEAGRIAQAFVGARRAGASLASYPGTAPSSLDEGYAVQDAAIALQGEAVGGWKVGRIAAPRDTQLGANRLAGPIFAPSIVDEGDGQVAMPVFAGGFAAAEAEFLLRVGTAPQPGKSDYTLEEAAKLIDAVHAGLEIASSPYPRINADGPTVTASDFGNNNGLVVGTAIPDWQDALTGWSLELRINDEVIGTGTGATMLDGPMGAAAFLFNLMAKRGIAVPPGTWISSGAITGVHEVVPGDRIEARFADSIAVRCVIAAY